ncbi:SIR2 family protein [Nocardioides aquiterrae]|uniref:Response regulator n=1 Tax=Nocardioides aquiterrae TaxID=203799 RepID=A0ABN1UCM3_9ACTN
MLPASDSDVVPQHLVDQVVDGRCVAFVGAGFAAPAVPAWKMLLRGLAERARLDDDTSGWVADLVENGGSRDLEAAAQVLQTAMGDAFDPALADILATQGRPDAIAERRRLLAGIPFDAILTTNFDPFLVGRVPGPETYQQILRDPPHRWWEPRYWTDDSPGAPVVKLHGEVGPLGDSVVFTQRGYRERLYSSPAYMTFLRSLFATSTVLFLGVSFTDAYLNELRSEVLAMIDQRDEDPPVAYAVLPDVAPHQARYLHSHEGLGTISYDTAGGTDWSGFDRVLRAIHDATNPRAQLGAALADRTVLWVDSSTDDIAFGRRVLDDAARDAGGRTLMVQARSVAEATVWLRDDRADLVIADLARDADGVPVAEALLTTMRREDLRAPVVVLSQHPVTPTERFEAISLGASEVAVGWQELFRELARIFA